MRTTALARSEARAARWDSEFILCSKHLDRRCLRSQFTTDAVVVLGAIIRRPKQAGCSLHIGATTPPSRGAGYNVAHPAPARSRSTRYEQGRGAARESQSDMAL